MEEVLSEAGITVTDEQLTQIAEDSKHVAEMEWEATGQEFIPNPLESDVRELKNKLEKSQEETREAHWDFRKNVAMRRNVRPECVTLLGDGYAEYE